MHLTGVGLCTITASQAGDGVFKPAAPVPQTFRIMSNQTIDFGPLGAKTYGDPDFTVAASATSGLVVSFAADGDCTVTGTTVHITGAGSCSITASQAGDANYNAAPDVTRSFAIARALLTVRPEPFASSRQYSDPNPAYTPVITGFVNGEDPGVLTSAPTCGTLADANSAPGPYAVTCSGAAARNYDVAYVPGTLTVTKEDAETTYTGDRLAFTAANASSAPVLLRATVRDSSVSPAFPGDTWPGDILKATITFKEGGTTLCSPSLELLNGDPETATASCLSTLSLGSHEIDILVNGYYMGADQVIVEVAEPDGSYVTGGGYTRVGTSGGSRLADPGSKVHFGFNLKYNKALTNLKGHVTVVFTSGGSRTRSRARLRLARESTSRSRRAAHATARRARSATGSRTSA